MTESEYINLKSKFIDVLDEALCGLWSEKKAWITALISVGEIEAAEAELAQYPRCVDFVIRAEHQILVKKRNAMQNQEDLLKAISVLSSAIDALCRAGKQEAIDIAVKKLSDLISKL